MKDWIYHGLVGNDAPPQLVATVRGVLLACTAGGSAAVAAWAVTDVLKEIIIPALAAFLSVFSVRVLGEGTLDRWRNGR